MPESRPESSQTSGSAGFAAPGTAAPRDALARDVRFALEHLLEDRGALYPDGRPVGPALWGRPTTPDSPSVVWSAQGAEALLEVGYGIDDAVFLPYLDFFEARLQEDNYFDPERTADGDENSPWILRTRHVAWILRCLYRPHGDDHEADGSTRRRAQVASTAFRLLAGEESAGKAANWIGIRADEQYWSEQWRRRRPNLLNTIYAVRAVCRASRRGIEFDERHAWIGHPTPAVSTTNFTRSVIVRPESAGPRANLEGAWLEPWATSKLPCAVVALLALLFCEYGEFLATNRSIEPAARAFDMAQRLGHELISRSLEWTDAVEGFSYAGAEGGWWYVPTYSLGVQAILDSGAAPPQHPTVVEALRTIAALTIERTGPQGSFQTWRDPTRGGALVEQFGANAAEQWHGIAHVGQADVSGCEPTAGSIHAATMAWCSVRRAMATGDPRTLLKSRAVARLPRSPFARVFVDTAPGARNQVQVETASRYAETVRLRSGGPYLIDACGWLNRPATIHEIADAVAERVPDMGIRATRTAEGVRAGIRELNKTLGVAFIRATSVEPPTYVLSAQLYRRATGQLRQEKTSVEVKIEWRAVAPAGDLWSGTYEVVSGSGDDFDLSSGPAELDLPVFDATREITLAIDVAHGTVGRFAAEGGPP